MNSQFHILSFEGPDGYARAGGIASRVSGLAEALAARGFETHLWFVGDPALPGHETVGQLHLHRWCQWISRHHPAGVYDGEEGKRSDYASSLPPYLVERVLGPHLRSAGSAVVLAEEWHTADAVIHLHDLLEQRGRRGQVTMLWNANNSFGFERIDWARLGRAAGLTTVSRYMKHRMWPLGVDPVVIPNGIPLDAFLAPKRDALGEFHRRFRDRVVLAKVARFDPDKRWLLAVQIVAELKRNRQRPLLIARGGVEAHGSEVRSRAAALGLSVAERRTAAPGEQALLVALAGLEETDLVLLDSYLDPDSRRMLLRGADAVLANSGQEPFGLIGLETMAVGGIACTGTTGEDYAVPGRNALVLQTDDPREFAALFGGLRADPQAERALRRSARATARQYLWREVVERNLVPQLNVAHTRQAFCRAGGPGRPRPLLAQPG